jgi:hypothetical protein
MHVCTKVSGVPIVVIIVVQEIADGKESPTVNSQQLAGACFWE